MDKVAFILAEFSLNWKLAKIHLFILANVHMKINVCEFYKIILFLANCAEQGVVNKDPIA